MTDRRRSQRPSTPAPIEVGGFAGAFVAVLVAGGVLLAGAWWWRGGGRAAAPLRTDAAQGVPTAVIAYDALNGVTAAGEPQLGLAAAPVEIISYGDYLCPNCKQFAQDVLPAIKDRWIRTGFVRVVHRDFIVFGPESQRAAEAAHCAGDGGRYWRYSDGLFALRASGATLDIEPLSRLARSLELAEEAFRTCMNTGRHRARVEATTASAKAQEFAGTPVYLVNGRKLEGALPLADWVEMLRLFEQELGQVRPNPSAAP